MFKILINAFKTKYLKDKRGPSLVDFDSVESFCGSLEEEVQTLSITESESEFNNLLDDDVKKALEGLPDDFRAVILLSTVEGFSYKEISKMFDCPVGTVMSRIYRGRKMLKERLASYAREHGYERE